MDGVDRRFELEKPKTALGRGRVDGVDFEVGEDDAAEE